MTNQTSEVLRLARPRAQLPSWTSEVLCEFRPYNGTVIRTYHRPRTLDEALRLIARTEPRTLPSRRRNCATQSDPQPFEVVDLQALALNGIREQGNE